MEQATSQNEESPQDSLGGRLSLLFPSDLDTEQKRLHVAIEQSSVARSKAMGYTAMFPNGCLIGPFNALLRNPPLAMALGAWTSSISSNSKQVLDDVTRELVILSIGVHWKADYVVYAHTTAAREVKADEADILHVLSSAEPKTEGRILIAYRVTRQLIRQERLDQQLYLEARNAFGEAGLVALVALIGQYMHTSVLLNCFEIPAPR